MWAYLHLSINLPHIDNCWVIEFVRSCFKVRLDDLHKQTEMGFTAHLKKKKKEHDDWKDSSSFYQETIP